MPCSKVVLLLLVFVCLASAKHKELNKNKFSLCDLFAIKKPQAVTVGPSSTSPAPYTIWVDTFTAPTPEPVPLPPAVPPQVLQYPQQPELQSQYQEFEYPPQQQQLPSYLEPQQGQQYPAQQPAQNLPPSQGGQPQTQLQSEYHRYPPQGAQTPTQESQYQRQEENENRSVQQQQGIQQPSQYQQQTNPSQPVSEYRPLQQQVLNQPTQEELQKTQQLGPLRFPPAQYSAPYFQGFPNGYAPPESSVYYQQQQMEPTKRIVVGYFDKQNVFHSVRPYNTHARRQSPYNSQYFDIAQPNYLPPFRSTP